MTDRSDAGHALDTVTPSMISPINRQDSTTASPLPPHPVSPSEAIAEAELSRASQDQPVATITIWQTRLAPHLAISAGAVGGANARFLVGSWVAARWGETFPWGTLLINVTGSLILGFYLTLVTERFTGRATVRLFVATGFLGAYTTFSAFSYEAVQLIQRGAIFGAVAYIIASLTLGLIGVVLGIVVARAL